MKLIPDFASTYDEYWSSLKKYNLWFIKLRNYAALSLFILYIILKFLLKLDLTFSQELAIILVTALILIYNFSFKKILDTEIKNSEGRKHIHLEFYQTIFDLISLSLLVYFLGGIEAPIFMFYIFHMIIGSLILPVSIMYFIASIQVIFLFIFSLLEYYAIIPHHTINGLYANSFYNDLNFVIGFIFAFSFVIFFCIYLTNKIVYELYAREGHLKNALDQLNEAEESKQKYIMAVVHELKSPIAAATSFLDLVLGGYVGKIDDLVRDKIEKARLRTEESIETINSILRISRFRLLNKLEKEKLSLIDILQPIIKNITPVSERKKTHLSIHTSGENFELMGDKVLLNLVFSNLIGNSVKYTPEDGKIEVTVNDEKEKITIKIEDDGIGIPKKDQDKIFEEFYRASNAKEKKIEGTGTGLNIVKHVIDSHGGQIELTSPSSIGRSGRPGTLFTLVLSRHI